MVVVWLGGSQQPIFEPESHVCFASQSPKILNWSKSHRFMMNLLPSLGTSPWGFLLLLYWHFGPEFEIFLQKLLWISWGEMCCYRPFIIKTGQNRLALLGMASNTKELKGTGTHNLWGGRGGQACCMPTSYSPTKSSLVEMRLVCLQIHP